MIKQSYKVLRMLQKETNINTNCPCEESYIKCYDKKEIPPILLFHVICFLIWILLSLKFKISISLNVIKLNFAFCFNNIDHNEQKTMVALP